MKALYLVGFRGVGKTTLGRRLSREMGFHFLDMDEEWERREEISIVEAVEVHGLLRFRQKEEKLLAEIDSSLGAKSESQAPTIVATGGGVVESEVNRKLLKASRNPKVLLYAPASLLWARLEPFPDRRRLGNLQSLEDMCRLMGLREGYYEEIATHRVLSQDITGSLVELKQLVTSLWQPVP